MGKRSDFIRRDGDAYDTPADAVWPLLPHLVPESRFIEPCAGRGALVTILEAFGHVCVDQADAEPRSRRVREADARSERWPVQWPDAESERDRHFSYFITNPPWDRDLLHPIIENLSNQKRTWLLFDTDWLFTGQAAPYLNRLQAIVTVGRVKWIEGTAWVGKENCAWYLFDRPFPKAQSDATLIEFFARSDQPQAMEFPGLG